MKHMSRTISAILLLALLVGCNSGSKSSPNQKVIHVGMILGSGGLGDRSFNDAGYAGLQEAQKLYDIRFETIAYTAEKPTWKNCAA